MRALIFLILALVLCGSAYPARAGRTGPPNIVFVFIDDMGYGDLEAFAPDGVRTENISRLAEEGLRFRQFYVNSPICSPSRTAVTTGHYPARWRITSYIDNRGLNERRGMAQFLDPAAPTLARMLRESGYTTGHFGKWHLGGGRDVGEAPLINEYGFDQSLTQFEGLGDRILPIFDPHNGMPANQSGLGLASEKLGRGKVEWLDRCQVTAAFVDRAIGFMDEASKAGKPFYINLWPDDVHTPLFPPGDLRGDGSKRALYEGVLKNMDRQLGPLFNAVRENAELRDNTLILLASDNGHEGGAGRAPGLRGSKANLYEGGIRSPLIVWGPGLIAATKRGSVNSESLLSGVDLVPSLLKLAGRPLPTGVNFDGVDLASTLTGHSTAGREKPLFWKRPPDRPGPPEATWPDLAVREGAWKLLINEDGSKAELFDLTADPGESKNLAEEHPDLVERLRGVVMEWNRGLPSNRLLPAG